jgi:hypothetical protein
MSKINEETNRMHQGGQTQEQERLIEELKRKLEEKQRELQYQENKVKEQHRELHALIEEMRR